MPHTPSRGARTIAFAGLAALALSSALVAGAGLGAVAAAAPSGHTTGAANAHAIVQDSVTADEAASSVTISGTFQVEGTTYAIKMTDTRAGEGAGTLSIGGDEVHIVGYRGQTYLMSSEAFWRSAGEGKLAKRMADRWIRFPGSNTFAKDFSGFTNSKSLFSSLEIGATFTDARTEQLNGRPVHVVTAKGTDGQGAGTLYIAASGPPYILKVTAPTDNDAALLFSSWGGPARITEPKDAVNYDSRG